MSSVHSQIAALGPVGRLPLWLAILTADLVGMAVAVLAHAGGFIVYGSLTALLVFGSGWIVERHEGSIPRGPGKPILPRLAGVLVALGASPAPWWFFVLIFVGYDLLGQLRLPPLKWFASWLPAGAARVADDLAAGVFCLLVSAVITF